VLPTCRRMILDRGPPCQRLAGSEHLPGHARGAVAHAGQVQWMNIAQYRWMERAEEAHLRPGAGTVALPIHLSADGPFVVDVPTALQEAALAVYWLLGASVQTSCRFLGDRPGIAWEIDPHSYWIENGHSK
jgi:hypothetical protein